LSYQAVADNHDVSKSTLQRLLNGGISMSAFTASGSTQGAAQDFSFFGQNSREHL
jgi:hypothetical protein